MTRAKKIWLLFAIVLLVLVIDQTLKFWVKTHMSIGEEIRILGSNWAIIHFVENPGMAFGLSFEGEYGKLALSLFRILAVVLLSFYLRWMLKENLSAWLIAGFGLILAGALGNIIDSAVYGLLFSESTFHGQPAVFLPPEGGYAGFLHGKVVDMLYFPIVEGYYPDWFPFWGGEPFLFFRPVFNIADVSITLGVLLVLVLQLIPTRHVLYLDPRDHPTYPILALPPGPQVQSTEIIEDAIVEEETAVSEVLRENTETPVQDGHAASASDTDEPLTQAPG